jgi:hypothetical protein
MIMGCMRKFVVSNSEDRRPKTEVKIQMSRIRYEPSAFGKDIFISFSVSEFCLLLRFLMNADFGWIYDSRGYLNSY